jgi:hypothetical protein
MLRQKQTQEKILRKTVLIVLAQNPTRKTVAW